VKGGLSLAGGTSTIAGSRKGRLGLREKDLFRLLQNDLKRHENKRGKWCRPHDSLWKRVSQESGEGKGGGDVRQLEGEEKLTSQRKRLEILRHPYHNVS